MRKPELELMRSKKGSFKKIYIIGYVDSHEDDAWVKLPGFSHWESLVISRTLRVIETLPDHVDFSR